MLLIDKQRQTRLKGKAGKLFCCFVDCGIAFETTCCAVAGVEGAWLHWEDLGYHRICVCTQ